MSIIQVIENLSVSVAVGVGCAAICNQIMSYQLVKFHSKTSRKLEVARLNNETLSDYKGAVSSSCYYLLERAKVRATSRGEIWTPTCIRLASMRGHTDYTLFLD